jgi:hypothetical protein
LLCTVSTVDVAKKSDCPMSILRNAAEPGAHREHGQRSQFVVTGSVKAITETATSGIEIEQ